METAARQRSVFAVVAAMAAISAAVIAFVSSGFGFGTARNADQF